jgi:choline kinase
MRDARLWRAANSAQWVAWGIVQAHVPGMNDDLDVASRNELGQQESSLSPITPRFSGVEDPVPVNTPKEEIFNPTTEDENEFDYLAYAQGRAMSFWGDLLSLGVISAHELPPKLLPKLKVVNY